MANDDQNADQRDFWTEFSRVWVDHQDKLDASFAPVLQLVFDHAGLEAGQKVLDIGCGTGTSTLEAAEQVGESGFVTGVDISAPMIDRARTLAHSTDNVAFDVDDAATSTFPNGPFDRVISRFGTMFFSDSVFAFRNIRAALNPGATVTMACWSHLDANPWFKVPMLAAKDVLGAPPKVDPDAPGPLAFRDIGRVTGILEEAGFADVAGKAVSIKLTPSGNLAQVAYQCSLIGPAARTLKHFDGGEDDLQAIAARVANSYEHFVEEDGVRVPAEINIFTASA